ncbi:MAG: ATP-binding protein, partial [Pseudomonadota bacterium]
AMKTYLAGARLLLKRGRPDEALASFGRIDDLIARMGSITRQLKSFARKDQEHREPVEMQQALDAALEMMEPQLRRRSIRITKVFPPDEVIVMADRTRIAQVIVNLLRNAVDATKSIELPELEIVLGAGREVVLTIRDNGPGIADLDALFEPFYTTKAPGEGVGLGLAISSGIVADLGGRLTARNVSGGGAVFEIRLPSSKAQPRAVLSQTAAE